MTQAQLQNEIVKRYGNITRARDCFLYTKKNVRLTDLFLDDGRALLGWKTNALSVFKNVFERGINGTYANEYVSRIPKAISVLTNDERIVFAVFGKARALSFAKKISNDAKLFRVFETEQDDCAKNDYLVFVPPFPFAIDVYFVAVKNNANNVSFTNDLRAEFPFCVNDNFFLERALPASISAGIARSFFDLKKAMNERREKHFFRFDKILQNYFVRKGAYLFPKISEARYDDFVKHCLDCALVINPTFSEPSIVPYKAESGVFRKLGRTSFQ